MKTKKRIFAAVIAVLLLVLTSVNAFAGFRLYFYELDFEFDAKREMFCFTSVADASYYEIRGFAPGETISSTTGVLLGTYTPVQTSTGYEIYEVPLNPAAYPVIDKAVLAALKLKPYYTLVVFSWRTTPVMHSVTVTANYCDVVVSSNGNQISSTGGTFQVQDGSSISVTFYDRGQFKTYYGNYIVMHGGIDITDPEYGLDGSNKLQGVYGDDFTTFTVNNITADVVISMTASEPPPPDYLDTPSPYIYDNESLVWSYVDGATDYCVEIRKGRSSNIDSAVLVATTYISDMGIDIAGYYAADGYNYYFARVKACYSTDIVESDWSDWFTFDFSVIPTSAAPIDDQSADLQAVDYASTDTTDTGPYCNGESNPLTFIGTGGACNKPHIVDKNGDGYDDASFIAGSDSSGTALTDLIPSILGAVAGFFISTTGNMTVAGVSVLSILSVIFLAFLAIILIKAGK